MRLGGWPIHSVWMITWTSEMSGSASSGIRLSDQTPASTSASTPTNRMKRFALHQSIVLSIILLSSLRHGAAGRYVHLFGRDRTASLRRDDRQAPSATAKQFDICGVDAVALVICDGLRAHRRH